MTQTMQIPNILKKLGKNYTFRRFTEVETDAFYKTKDRSTYVDSLIWAVKYPYSTFTGREAKGEYKSGEEDIGKVKIIVDVAANVIEGDHMIDGTSTYQIISKDLWKDDYYALTGQVV